MNLHFSSGMQALVTVKGAATGLKNFEKTGVTRTYYIQVSLLRSTSSRLRTPLQLPCP